MGVTVQRMGRRRLEDNKTCYSGAVAARLRELRDSKNWSVEDLQNKIREVGVSYECPECGKSHVGVRKSSVVRCPRYDCNGLPEAYELEIPTRTIYAYESGKYKGVGADLPWDYLPVIAEVYGYSTATGWLPDRLED